MCVCVFTSGVFGGVRIEPGVKFVRGAQDPMTCEEGVPACEVAQPTFIGAIKNDIMYITITNK